MKAAGTAVLALAAAWAVAALLVSISVPRHVLVPILVYHSSSETEPEQNPELFVRPSLFRDQMTWLLENGYTFCTFDDIPRLRRIHKPVMVTFDDGYLENYTEIFPILQELGIKITIFVFNYTQLPAAYMAAMAASGLVTFESHGATHTDMTSLSPYALEAEFIRSSAWIAEITGRWPAAVSYPMGWYDSSVKRTARAHFQYGVGTGGRRHSTASDPLAMRRYTVPRSMGMAEFTALFGGV
jgi:peptidoglycan/xylan/chitin deacetylase (PgdA/CDA1 family)